MSTTETLLAEIAAFCSEFRIPESTFGRRAMNDGKFVERVRQGGGLTVANLDRIRAYMDSERASAGVTRRAETKRPKLGRAA